MRTVDLARSVGLALTAAALVSCRDVTGPEAFAGTYVLANDRLPAHLFTNEFGAWFATADTLRLGVDGQGSESGSSFVVPADASIAPTPPTFGKVAFSFRVVDGRLEIIYFCPPNANCIRPTTIVERTPGGLHITYPNNIRRPQDYVELRRVP